MSKEESELKSLRKRLKDRSDALDSANAQVQDLKDQLHKLKVLYIDVRNRCEYLAKNYTKERQLSHFLSLASRVEESRIAKNEKKEAEFLDKLEEAWFQLTEEDRNALAEQGYSSSGKCEPLQGNS